MEGTIIENLRARLNERPFLKRIMEDEEITENNLDSRQSKLMSNFVDGLSIGLNLPAENFSEKEQMELLDWILNFARSFMRPEWVDEARTPRSAEINAFGAQIGRIITSVLSKHQVDVEQFEKSATKSKPKKKTPQNEITEEETEEELIKEVNTPAPKKKEKKSVLSVEN